MGKQRHGFLVCIRCVSGVYGCVNMTSFCSQARDIARVPVQASLVPVCPSHSLVHPSQTNPKLLSVFRAVEFNMAASFGQVALT